MVNSFSRWQILLCLFLIPLPLFIPYLWLDHLYFWANPDSIFYINVYTSYRDALWQGEFFPHWISNTNAGLGSLVFYNRSPLPYSLTALLNAPFYLSDEHQYLFGIYASQVCGASLMFRWLRNHYNKRIAVFGALLYTLIPYKFIDIYRHFNLALCWALAFLPLWFHSAEQIKTHRGIFCYAMAAALCFYSHPLTVLSVGPLAGAYAFKCAQWQWHSILKPLIAAHFLALCLVASYLSAMLASFAWLPMEGWSSENFSSLHNLYHIDDFIGLYALLLAWLVYRARSALSATIKNNSLYFWSLALIVLYVIATPISYPLWAYVRWMDVFQFPFSRMQPAMGIISALLAVCLLSGKQKEYNIAVIAIYALFIALCLMHIQMVYKRPKDVSMLVEETALQYHIIPGPIYLPVWTPLTPNELLLAHEKYAALPLAVVKDGNAVIDAARKGDGWLTLYTHVESENATMVLSQFYIPAWQALSDGQPVELSPYMDGFIKLILPKGEHEVHLMITKSLFERIGDMLTLGALALYVLPLRVLCAFKRT